MAGAILPGFKEEKRVRVAGYRLIAGVDEVGRGPLAGPVAAAAVVLPYPLQKGWAKLVRDSKFLNPKVRERLFDKIIESAVSHNVAFINPEKIDEIGIGKAALMAMCSAVQGLNPAADYALVDHFQLPDLSCPHDGVKDGDSLCFSIACASIVAKVARDRLMNELDAKYPGYGFDKHKGYSTRRHYKALQQLGPSPVHRFSFQPVRDAVK